MAKQTKPDLDGSEFPETTPCDTPSPRNTIQRSRDLLDEREAAAYLDVSDGTLPVWRSTGRYNLPFIKVGRKVRYRRADLDSWLASRTRANGATA